MSQPVVVPQLTPPSHGSTTGRLPDDVVAEQARRARLFSGIGAFLWSFGLSMETIFIPWTGGPPPMTRVVAIEIVGVATAVAMYLWLRFGNLPPQKAANAGLYVLLINAFQVSVLESVNLGHLVHAMGHPSWLGIVILLSAMIVPSSPRRTLIGSLVAATMPVVVSTTLYLAGLTLPSLDTLLVMYLPNYVWAAVATLPATQFHRMGRSLKEARELGSYELIEQLGAGGMGAVWRAKHRLLARDAAVKLVRPEALGDTDTAAQAQLRRFEREAQATALLQSQHSIRLFDFGSTQDGSFYYVMELLEGRDLESLIKEFGPLSPERAMHLLQQICHSLAEAHARGLVHRDIKPANIFVCRMGLEFDFIKVLDFGLVQTRRADPAAAVTETLVTAQQLIGTPAYMAPEIILGRTDIDRRADVYAIGCVAIFMLTGTRVFQDGNQMQVLVDHVHTAPVSPSRRLTQPLPSALDELVLDCLRKNPEERPRDAADLLCRINEIRLGGRWSNEQARLWWEAKLPQLAGPLH